MEKALWYLIAGTRGGENRARIIRVLDEKPRNANRLAEELDVDYNTVRHLLDMLRDHDVVETGGDYGELYFLTATRATSPAGEARTRPGRLRGLDAGERISLRSDRDPRGLGLPRRRGGPMTDR